MRTWIILSALFNIQGLYAQEIERRAAPRCKNPKGELWSSRLDRSCRQSVCRTNGRRAEWVRCPKPVSEDTIGELEKTMESNKEELFAAFSNMVTNVCEVTNNGVDNFVHGRKYQGKVLKTIQNIASSSACLGFCKLHGSSSAGVSYDSASKECVIFAQITGQFLLADAGWVSSPCPQSGKDACISNAISILFNDKLEGTCSFEEESPREPFHCFKDIPNCGLNCYSKPTAIEKATCMIDCVPADCEEYVCDVLGRWPTAKKICKCLPKMRSMYQTCRNEHSDSWPDTIECIVGQLLKDPCITVLCDILKYLVPEVPEAEQVCNCAIPIVGETEKCHDQYGDDWENVVKCVTAAVGKDCKDYICKFAGKIFPPIKKLPVCKPSDSKA